MGLRINTNIASLTAQKNLATLSGRLQGNIAPLSSGLRIASASDDAAGLGLSERMRSHITSYQIAGRNAQDGVSLAQTEEAALNEVSNMLIRMRELAMQSTNGVLSDDPDRDVLDDEFQSLVNEIDRIASETEFAGVQLLDGSVATTSIQVGLDSGETIDIINQDATASTLGIDSLDVQTASNADSALATLDDAIDDVNASRGSLGAVQNRLTSAMANIDALRENLSAAESRIRDVDVASESADLTRNSILQQAATSVLAQANVQPQLALSLLG